jgi:hypothetical protein
MDFDAAIDALTELEYVPVAMDSLITNPAGDYEPDDLCSTSSGLLRIRPDEPTTARPVDEAAWFVRRRERQRVFHLERGTGGASS